MKKEIIHTLTNEQTLQLNAHYPTIMQLIAKKCSFNEIRSFTTQGLNLKKEVEVIDSISNASKTYLNELIRERDKYKEAVVSYYEAKGSKREEINPDFINRVIETTFPKINELNLEWLKVQMDQKKYMKEQSLFSVEYFLTDSHFVDVDKSVLSEVMESILLLMKPETK